MKFKLFAMILALSLAAWAQESPSTSTPNSTPAPETKSCCHHTKAGDAKECCHHAAADAKDGAGCCGKGKCGMKDGKSCCSGKEAKACMKECKKNGGCEEGKCCGAAGDKSAKSCCGTKCERHAPSAS